MKKILILLSLVAFISFTINAQLPTVAKKIKTYIPIQDNGGIQPLNATYSSGVLSSYPDTLKSGDTLFYKLPIKHARVGFPYLSLNTKLVANDTTSKIDFWQSVDGVNNWQRIYKDSTGIAVPTIWYPTLIAKSTTKGTVLSFWQVAARFESQYLGVRIIANVKSGFKTIYYGSYRFNSN